MFLNPYLSLLDCPVWIGFSQSNLYWVKAIVFSTHNNQGSSDSLLVCLSIVKKKKNSQRMGQQMFLWDIHVSYTKAEWILEAAKPRMAGFSMLNLKNSLRSSWLTMLLNKNWWQRTALLKKQWAANVTFVLSLHSQQWPWDLTVSVVLPEALDTYFLSAAGNQDSEQPSLG